MTDPATTAALLALWTRCPECAPDEMSGVSDSDFYVLTQGASFTYLDCIQGEAIACDAIERWIIGQQRSLIMRWHDGNGWIINAPHRNSSKMLLPIPACHPTKLAALLAAANAVLDAAATKETP